MQKAWFKKENAMFDEKIVFKLSSKLIAFTGYEDKKMQKINILLRKYIVI